MMKLWRNKRMHRCIYLVTGTCEKQQWLCELTNTCNIVISLLLNVQQVGQRGLYFERFLPEMSVVIAVKTGGKRKASPTANGTKKVNKVKCVSLTAQVDGSSRCTRSTLPRITCARYYHAAAHLRGGIPTCPARQSLADSNSCARVRTYIAYDNDNNVGETALM